MTRLPAVLALVLVVTACGDDDDSDSENLTGEEWCAELWDEGVHMPDWDRETHMRDCTDGLEAGFTRDMIRSIYEEGGG
jgi:hypothetical protein